MATTAIAEENDWAQKHPVPESTVNGDLLILWNYPVGKSDLSTVHKNAIRAFLDSEWMLGPWNSRAELTVLGHASDTGDPKQNGVLARARAEKVVAHLRAQGASSKSIYMDSAGSTHPVDDGSNGLAFARNRRVDITKFTPALPEPPLPPLNLGEPPPPPPSEPPPEPEPEPSPSGPVDLAPKYTEYQFAYSCPVPPPIRTNWVFMDVQFEAVVSVKLPTGGGSDLGLSGIISNGSVTPQAKLDLVDQVIGKISFQPSAGGQPATLKAGLQNKAWPLTPEAGWQVNLKKPGMPVYINLTLGEPLKEKIVVSGVPVEVTVTGKVKCDVGPGPGTVARVARAAAAAGQAVVAAAPMVGAAASGSGIAIGVAALVIGSTIVAIEQAKEDGVKFSRLLAERDGAACRVALEISGADFMATFRAQRLRWSNLPDVSMSDFDAGVGAVEALIPNRKEDLDEKKRAEKRADWKARVASDTTDFMLIRDRVFLAIGGYDREGTVQSAMAGW